MTVMENLRLGAYVKRTTSNQTENLEKVFALFPRLKERTTQQVRTLSGGERQMLSIGVGLMGMPVLLLLDEPSAGLAPKIKGELADAIGEIAKTGVTMIVVEQDVELLIQLCQRLYLIEKGRVSLETKDVSEVNQTEILEMYFGRVTQ
jgi:branched-chain amino acid transport system ATP-binding protein